MEREITHDQLLDYAQGRLTPVEMTEISRLLLKDPELQQRYAHLRRLQRILREHYRPEAVAHPEARDEAVAAMISSYVEAVRAGMAPPTEFAASLAAVPPVDSTGSHDAVATPAQDRALPATEPAVPGLAEVDQELEALERELSAAGIAPHDAGAQADESGDNEVATLPAHGRPRRSPVRSLLAYSAAAGLLVAAAAVSFVDPGAAPLTDDDADALPAQWLSEVTPPERPDELARPAREDREEEAPEIVTEYDEPDTASHDEDNVAQLDAEATRHDEDGSENGSEVRNEVAEADTATDESGTEAPEVAEAEASKPEDSDTSNGNRRPGGVDVAREGTEDSEAAAAQEKARRMADSSPIQNLTGGADGNEVVVERGPLPGDLNDDGVVDERDVRILSEALIELELEPEELYEHLGPAADLTGNGRIDVRDLQRLRELVSERHALEHQPGTTDE